MDLLCHYQWPGNVRQLISALEHSSITCSGDTVEISDLPDYLFQASPGEPPAKGDDRARLSAALAQFKGNKTLAAKHLGISRVTLWKKLKAANLASE
jgi:transcriptional regulator of acetoin/glycerol metabolism